MVLPNPTVSMFQDDETSASTPGVAMDPNPGAEWKTVVRRRRSLRGGQSKTPKQSVEGVGLTSYAMVAARNTPQRNRGPQGGKTGLPPVTRIKTLKTAAITITGLADSCSYMDALTKAKKHIQLDSLGIENSKIRRTFMAAGLLRYLERRPQRRLMFWLPNYGNFWAATSP